MKLVVIPVALVALALGAYLLLGHGNTAGHKPQSRSAKVLPQQRSNVEDQGSLEPATTTGLVAAGDIQADHGLDFARTPKSDLIALTEFSPPRMDGPLETLDQALPAIEWAITCGQCVSPSMYAQKVRRTYFSPINRLKDRYPPTNTEAKQAFKTAQSELESQFNEYLNATLELRKNIFTEGQYSVGLVQSSPGAATTPSDVPVQYIRVGNFSITAKWEAGISDRYDYAVANKESIERRLADSLRGR